MSQYHITSITPKGYILLPVRIRKMMGLKPHQSLAIRVQDSGLALEPIPTLDDVFSIARSAKKRTITQELIKEEDRSSHEAIANNALQESV